MPEELPITFFFEKLVDDPGVKQELRLYSGRASNELGLLFIQSKLERGAELDTEETNLVRVVNDVVIGDAKKIETIVGRGDYGEFEITINQYGPVFWVYAPEFGFSGYFESLVDAIGFANLTYDHWIFRAIDESES